MTKKADPRQSDSFVKARIQPANTELELEIPAAGCVHERFFYDHLLKLMWSFVF